MVASALNRRLSRWSMYTIVTVLAFIFVTPLLSVAANSLNPVGTLQTIFSTSFEWSNYKFAVTLVDYWGFLRNSLIICGISVFLTTFSSGFTGFAFARLQAPGKKALFLFILSTMMLPAIVTQIPTYILFHRIGLLDSYIPWVLWGIGGSPFFIFLYRQFFSSIPKEIEEAACIDGCSVFRTYWNIFIPLSAPVMITVLIMCFQGTWGDFITPFMFVTQDKYPLATGLIQVGYVNPHNTSIKLTQVSEAAVVLFIIPVLVTFFIGQRYMTDGIVSAGVKG